MLSNAVRLPGSNRTTIALVDAELARQEARYAWMKHKLHRTPIRAPFQIEAEVAKLSAGNDKSALPLQAMSEMILNVPRTFQPHSCALCIEIGIVLHRLFGVSFYLSTSEQA